MNEAPPIEEVIPGLRDQALILDINARVVEKNMVEIWNEVHKRVTIPGRPVGLKLVGANIVVAVQFIPYLRRRGPNVLVAQGQIWVDIPGRGMSYQTTMQTIPLEFEEPIYFFPLGDTKHEDEAHIEIILTMRPYKNAASAETGTQVNLGENARQGNTNPP